MADITFVGGPLNGQVRDVEGWVVNAIDDSRLGVVRMVSYRVDFDSASARVVEETDL